MRIANNIMAMNTFRNYSINNDNVAKAAEKLSSGYRINRAGDDAAGLAISEKMRAQISGLNMASKNSQDAISLVQTAEGALEETQSMLQRMNELAVQSASGTNESFDRSAIAAEFDQLKDEINQISTQTTFNNMNILDGTLGGGGTAVLKSETFDGKIASSATNGLISGEGIWDTTSAAKSTDYVVSASTGISTGKIGTFSMTTGILSDTGAWTAVADGTSTDIKIAFTGADGSSATYYVKLSDAISGNTYGEDNQTFKLDLSTAGLGTYTIKYEGTAANNTVANFADQFNGLTVTTTTGNMKTTGTVAAGLNLQMAGASAGSYSVTGAGNNAIFTNTITGASVTYTALGTESGTAIDLSSIGLGTFTIDATGGTAAQTATDLRAIGKFTIVGNDTENAGSGALKIQVGALEGEQMTLAIGKMDTDGLGISTQNIATQEKAGTAITATRNAINTVSNQRALLGAMQNRLEHKINNLSTQSENLTAAESRIRDVDIAKEMTEYTKSNILAQASTAMLAQANAAPQNVLSLLK